MINQVTDSSAPLNTWNGEYVDLNPCCGFLFQRCWNRVFKNKIGFMYSKCKSQSYNDVPIWNHSARFAEIGRIIKISHKKLYKTLRCHQNITTFLCINLYQQNVDCYFGRLRCSLLLKVVKKSLPWFQDSVLLLRCSDFTKLYKHVYMLQKKCNIFDFFSFLRVLI